MNFIPNNIIRQILILVIIFLLTTVLFVQLQRYLPGLLGAYTLYVILRKPMFTLESKYLWNKHLAAALLMLTSFVVILLPIIILVNMMSSKIAFAVNHSSEVIASIQRYIEQYEKKVGFDVFNADTSSRISSWISQTLPSVLGATFDTITIIAVMYFILYFMLTDGRRMESRFYEWVPLKDENILMLRTDLNKLVLSNAIGIPVIAFIQGVVGLIGYLALGVNEALFWFVVTCITAMLPVIGAAFAYVPLGILFFANDHPVKGIIMLIYGFGVIGTVDNFFRFWLQKKIGDVHPLITVFGVIAGIGLFGFIGLIFGPILIALLILLIRVYVNEFNFKKKSAHAE